MMEASRSNWRKLDFGWKCYLVGSILLASGFGMNCHAVGPVLVTLGGCGIGAGIFVALSKMD